MELQILLIDGTAKYIQIYKQIRQAILERKLSFHTKLPPKRRLAEQLNISITTVQIAYEQLQSEGYIYSIERQGYFVSEIEEEWQYAKSKASLLKKTVQPEYVINFKNGQVDAAVFPYKQWNRLYRKELGSFNASNAPWQGEWALREQIASYVQKARGLHCQPDQIYIFSGFQQQLMNVCLFLNTKAAGTEEPGFMRAKAVFEQLQLLNYAISVDAEGCSIPDEAIKLLYTTPAHQYPTGAVMSIARKTQLLQWARKQNAYIIEDDYDAEFRYKGAPIAPLAHLDSFDRVIYFGTFSKTLLPSLRMSYLVMPASLQPDYEKFNMYQKPTVSKIDQQVVAGFMAEGLYAAHIAKMRTLYRAKRRCLLESIFTYLGDEFKVKGDAAGLHIIIQLPERLHESQAIELAKSRRVAIDGVSIMYQSHKPSHQVMLGYGAPTLDEIQRGVRLLADVWKS